MPLTQSQIQAFTIKAKGAGLTDEQIRQAVAKKEQELRGATIDTRGVTVKTDPATTTTDPALVPKPLEDGSGNFITNTAKALVQPAVDYGKFVGESVVQASRAGAEALTGRQGIFGADELDRQIGQLTRQSRDLISQAKAEKDKTKKKELLAKSREIDAQIDQLGSKAGEIGNKQKTFLVDEEKIKDRGSIAKTGAKATAGAASYAIPGSIGTGATALGTVTRAAGAGAVAGGLQGFGSSEDGQEISDTVTGAMVGGATAGAISGAGQVIKMVRDSRLQSDIGKKIAQTGTDFKKSAYVKAAGRKPILREGGDKLLDKMLKAGIKPGSPEELIFQADDILLDNAGVIFSKADEFKQNGVTIDKAKILGPLEKKLESAPAKSKPIIEKVIGFVKDDLDRFDELSPAEAYAMKGDYGPFGNWTSTMDADAITEANLWEDVYLNLNNLMDDAFKKGGYDDFRKVNELVSTAINAKKFAARAGNVAPNLNTLGLLDTLSGGAGFIAGGLPGMATGYLGKKVINSPQFSSVAGKTLEKVGTNLTTNTNTQRSAGNTVIGEVLSRLAQRGLVDASTGSGDLISDPNENMQSNDNQNGFDNSNEQNAPFSDNNAGIIPQQTSRHPIPKFREFATKDEMITAAFADGLGTKEVTELAALWDQFAPAQSDIDTLIEKRKAYADAGYSTASIDKQLEQMGMVRSSDAEELPDELKKYAPAVTRGLERIEEISGINSGDSIFKGGSTTVGKAVKSAGVSAKLASDPEYANQVDRYKQSLNSILGPMNQMLGAGVLNDGEALRLLDNIPDENTSEAVAKAWFDDVRFLLGIK